MFGITIFSLFVFPIINSPIANVVNEQIFVFVKKENVISYINSTDVERKGVSVLASCWISVEEKNGRVALRKDVWFEKQDTITLSEAIDYFSKEIQNDPKNHYAFTCRGIAYEKTGDFVKALADFNEGIRLNQMNYVALLNRGKIHFYQNNYDDAISDFEKLIQLNPKTSLPFSWIGKIMLAKEDHEKAITYYSKAILIDSNVPSHFEERGKIYFINRNYERALDDFIKLKSLAPNFSGAYFYCSLIRLEKKQFDMSMTEINEAIRLNSKNPNYYFLRGQIWVGKRIFDKALADFEDARRLGPGNVDVHRKLAHLLATCPEHKIRNGSKAINSANLACELTKWNDPFCLSDLAAAYAETNQFDNAVKFQEIAIKIAKNNNGNFDLAKANSCLTLYKDKKPFRDD